MDWHLGLCSVGKKATAHLSMWSSDRTAKGYLICCVLVLNIKKAAVKSYLPARSPFQVPAGSLHQAPRKCKKKITEAWEWRDAWVIECNCFNSQPQMTRSILSQAERSDLKNMKAEKVCHCIWYSDTSFRSKSGANWHWKIRLNFPGGSVVKNLPTNAGDPWLGKIPHATSN